MKKLMLIALFLCAIFFAGCKQERTDVSKATPAQEEIVQEEHLTAKEDVLQDLEIPSTVNRATEKEETTFDVSGNLNDCIGHITSDYFDEALHFGAEKEAVLHQHVALQSQISTEKYLLVLGHNCEQVPRLGDIMFTNLKQLKVGEKVQLTLNGRTYALTVKSTEYVSPEAFKANRYSSIRDAKRGNVCFVTCEWDKDNVKGRRIVYFEATEMK